MAVTDSINMVFPLLAIGAYGLMTAVPLVYDFVMRKKDKEEAEAAALREAGDSRKNEDKVIRDGVQNGAFEVQKEPNITTQSTTIVFQGEQGGANNNKTMLYGSMALGAILLVVVLKK